MKKIFIIIISIMCLSIFMVTSFAEATETEITYGKGKMKLKLVDDFSKSVAGSTSYGTVTVEDTKIKMASSTIADIYGITVPNSVENKTLYAGVKYFAFSIKSTSDDDFYFCFQPQISGSDNKFLSPEGGKVYLVDKAGTRLEAEWNDEDSMVNGRFGFIVPMEFDGYVLIPTSAIVTINEWDTSIWKEGDHVSAVGFHASPVTGGNTNIEIGDMYVLSDLAAYEPVATPEPSPTPEATNTPEATEAQPTATVTPTASANATEKKDIDKNDNNMLVFIGIGVAALVVVGIIVFVIVKRGKK